MSDTNKPDWWKALSESSTITLSKAQFLELIDSAISAGRTNWDSYYGYSNDYHISIVLDEQSKDNWK